MVCPDGPVAEETDTPARTWVGAGGQAANVAAWITALGGQARLIAARGTDLAARLVATDLSARGVDVHGPVLDGPTGVVVSLSHDGVSRSMLTDRGVGPRLSAEALARRLAGGLRPAAPPGVQPDQGAGQRRGAGRGRPGTPAQR